MKKNRLYLKYLIKSPFLFITLFVAEVILISYLLVTIHIDTIITYNGEIQKEGIKIRSEEDFRIKADLVYVYINRNEKIMPVKVSNVQRSEDTYYLDVTDKKMLEDYPPEIKVDVPVGERSLLEYIFTKGE